MATQNQRYTLVGFSRELDWKALNFVEPIPEYKTCNACGLVPRVTALLPCLHVVCQKCYEQCRHGDEHRCPLDGHRGLEEDVDWRKFTVNNLLKRKVKCWNEENGCDMVLAASELNKHFCQDCDYHSALCPKCSTVVLCRNMCAHLQSKCRNSAVSPTFATPRISNSDQNAVITALNATIEVRVGEIKDRLDCVANYSDRFDSISHCINNMKETLLQSSIGCCTLESVPSQTADTLSSVRAVQDTLIDHGGKLHELARTIKNSNKSLKGALEDTKRTVNSLKEDNAVNTLQVAFKDRLTADSDVLKKVCESVNELKETFGKELQVATTTICRNITESVPCIGETKDSMKKSTQRALDNQKELALNTVSVKRCEFFVKDLKAQKDIVHSKGYHDCLSEKLYISGYYVSPGVYLKKQGAHIFLYAGVQLHKGVIDEFLQWPFNQNVRVTVVHPSRSKQRQFVGLTCRRLECFGRPEELPNPGAYLGGSIRLGDLEREGYVVDDKFWIAWELVPNDVAD